MNPIQQKILDLSKTKNIAALKLREIGKLVGEPHPQKIKHHLNQLIKHGLLKQNADKTLVSPVNTSVSDDLFFFLPILGSANCGQATILADEYPEGYLQVSKSILPYYEQNRFFILKAVGNSMNKAVIKGKSINDKDYVVIDRSQQIDYQNKYILSIINGMANIKKFILDDSNNQIMLVSESTEDYSPIYIHRDDFQNYLVNGVVVDVIKRPVV